MPGMHSVWAFLFNNPDFWDRLEKDHFCMLLSTCNTFRMDIPQRMVIHRLFCNRFARKVAIFRLLPLSVNDMLRIPSPVNFWGAFVIAERKVRGFDNLMAIVRERGWRCWLERGEHRAVFRASVEVRLSREGITPPSSDPAYRSAITLQRRVRRLVVWRHKCMHGDAMSEYNQFLVALRNAMGRWYKGINADVRNVVRVVGGVRDTSVASMTHVMISNAVLMIGVISF